MAAKLRRKQHASGKGNLIKGVSAGLATFYAVFKERLHQLRRRYGGIYAR